MRLLLSAYACGPGRGSEPEVGWQWAVHLSQYHEVHVLTDAAWQQAIAAELAQRPRPNLRMYYIASMARQSAAWPWGLGWLVYYLWQWQAYKAAESLHSRHSFDLCHHITYVSWRVPSFLWRLGIPFIWGPIAGGESVPPGFAEILGWRGALYEAWRGVAQWLGQLDPCVRAAMRQASLILAANQPTHDFIPPAYRAKVRRMPAIGCDASWLNSSAFLRRKPGLPCRLLWLGRCEPRKALPLLLRALALLPCQERCHLTVIGSGPEEMAWRRLAVELGLKERVNFLGARPREEVRQHMADADIFVLTSLRDSSSFALLEAMASGLPSICLCWAGPAEIADDACAVRIVPRSPAQTIAEIAQAILALADDPGRREAMGRAAQQRCCEGFTWEERVRAMAGVYAEIMARRALA